MNEHFLTFTLAGRRCALPLARVERVLRAVEVTPLPGAQLPPIVRGVVNVHGTVVPVFDVREGRIGTEISETEQMILVALREDRQALILCDDVEGVRDVEAREIASSGELLPETLAGRGDVLTIDGELVYVNDLDALLESGAWQQLKRSLEVTEGNSSSSESIAGENGQ
jgi:purine-binding chemotaxis protein CheW